ncbi:MAG: DUF58 domain-containing protein [Chloroflexota bacterium]
MSFSERIQSSRSTFFSRPWLYLSAVMVLLGMIVREPALSLLGVAPLVTAGAAWLWARYSLENVEYTRELSTDRIFCGDTVQLRVTVVNRKLLPVASMEIEDQTADRLQIVGQHVLPSGTTGVSVLRITTAMRWYERVTWNIDVHCPARGYFAIGPVTLRASDAFGFFQRRERIPGESRIIVYPPLANLEDIQIPAHHLFGEQRIRRPIITDPTRTIGVRDYRPEDSFRHVHWKATARTMSLQTKIFEPTTTIQYGIFLNLDTFERYWQGLDFDRAEGAIIVAATLAAEAEKQGHAVGMYANGVVGGSDQPLRVRPSRSETQLDQILIGLAKLSPIASLNFPTILRNETVRFPMDSTIVLVTAIMTDEIRAVLEELSREGHHVVVLTIGEVDVPAITRVSAIPISMDALKPFIPDHHHYAVRMTAQPVPDLQPPPDGDVS